MKMVKKKTPLAKAAKGTAVKPKAMYGKTVKPTMMQTAGTVRKPQKGKTVKPKEKNQFYPSSLERGFYDVQDAVSNATIPEYVFGKPTSMRNMGTMNRTVDSLNVQDKAYGRYTPPRKQYLNAENIVNKKLKGGTLTKAQKGTAVKPKAMYGKSVKPGMMRKGGTKKK